MSFIKIIFSPELVVVIKKKHAVFIYSFLSMIFCCSLQAEVAKSIGDDSTLQLQAAPRGTLNCCSHRQ